MKKLTVTTFNIQHGRNHNLKGDVIDLPLMAQNAVDTGATVVGFNEVRRGLWDGIEGFPDTPRILGELIGGESIFGPAISLGEGRLYGNAVVSKYPILASEIVPIPDPIERTGNLHYESRCVIKALIDVDGTPVTLLVTHFGLNLDERMNAADTVLSIADDCGTPVIFMGDLNTTPDDPVYKRLAYVFKDVALSLGAADDTFPSDDPRMRIDYIFLKDLKPISVRTVKKIVSDHFALTAEIEMP